MLNGLNNIVLLPFYLYSFALDVFIFRIFHSFGCVRVLCVYGGEGQMGWEVLDLWMSLRLCLLASNNVSEDELNFFFCRFVLIIVDDGGTELHGIHENYTAQLVCHLRLM